jgi:hypothetical protein
MQSESFVPRLRTKPCTIKTTSIGSVALRETIIASLVLTRYDWQIALHLLRTISLSGAVTVVEQRIMSRMACSRVMLQGEKPVNRVMQEQLPKSICRAYHFLCDALSVTTL